jgi:hypothetical protein
MEEEVQDGNAVARDIQPASACKVSHNRQQMETYFVLGDDSNGPGAILATGHGTARKVLDDDIAAEGGEVHHGDNQWEVALCGNAPRCGREKEADTEQEEAVVPNMKEGRQKEEVPSEWEGVHKVPLSKNVHEAFCDRLGAPKRNLNVKLDSAMKGSK